LQVEAQSTIGLHIHRLLSTWACTCATCATWAAASARASFGAGLA
jgi:hypothetical protein